MKPSGNSSAEPLQVRRECGIIIFKVMNGKKKKQNTVPGKAIFRFEDEIKCFSNKQKLKRFSSSKPAL